jgi:hypothetical protein
MLSVYPSITSTEFQSACEALEQRCHNRLDGTNWLVVNWTGSELRIRQTRSLATPLPSAASPSITESSKRDGDAEFVAEDEIDDDDDETVRFLLQCSIIVTDNSIARRSYNLELDNQFLHHTVADLLSPGALVYRSWSRQS